MSVAPALFGPDDLVPPNPEVESAFFTEGQLSAVVDDPRTGERHHLNKSSAAIWALCDGETTVSTMVSELVEVFGIDPQTAAASIEQALAQFWKAGLIDGGQVPDSQPIEPDESTLPPVLARPPDP